MIREEDLRLWSWQEIHEIDFHKRYIDPTVQANLAIDQVHQKTIRTLSWKPISVPPWQFVWTIGLNSPQLVQRRLLFPIQ
ncbi:hypothetical protein M7I_6475 [Glarea lozoyensis 74030]|uniref:Uncharacterized protein n=1 Tax=Glarea lozoyensis (strain ATCC 74030 / MF5533) TaxID=1104152 RepID=H0EUN8_GLAL7|nr:hypothetical protein M7I_6475 [Glarea lozoyensis 74030]